MGVDKILTAIEMLYEAATDPARLSGIGSQIARTIGSESALVFVARKRDAGLERMVSASGNFDGRARTAYDEHFHTRNEWFLRGARLPSPVAVLGGELIDYAEFERTEFWNDWCKSVGIYHTLGSTAPIGNGRVAAMGIHRPRGREAFGEEERAVVRVLVPHLARSLLLAERLDMASWKTQAAYEVLHRLGVGLVLLGRAGDVLFVNALAERMVGRARWMTVSQGRIRAVHPASARPFAMAMGRVVAEAATPLAAGQMLRLRDPLSSELPVLVTPFRGGASAPELGHPVAAVVFADPDGPRPAGGVAVAAMLGLTPAEGALVAALADGETLGGYALRQAISVNTVRAQLRSIFAKTGFSRQSDLVAAVLRDPVSRLAS